MLWKHFGVQDAPKIKKNTKLETVSSNRHVGLMAYKHAEPH